MTHLSLKFRGIAVHPNLFQMYWNGSITADEFMLYITIDAMIDPEGNGCEATNEELGKLTGRKYRKVQLLLRSLERKGLVASVMDNGKRYLETVYGREPIFVGGAHPCAGRTSVRGGPYLPSYYVRVKYSYSGRRVQRPGKGDGMFFPEDTKEKVLETDFTLADTLHKIVVEKLQIKKAWSRNKWAKEFSILRKETDQIRIGKVLDWYIIHCKDDKVPSITSATKFREHFGWLEKLTLQAPPNKVELSDEAVTVSNRLLHRKWPKGSADQVPYIVQLSIDQYIQVRDGIGRAGLRNPKLKDFCIYVLNRLGSPAHFVEQWMISVFEQVANWKEWSGELKSFAFTVTHKRFQTTGKGLAVGWGDRKAWDKLMEALKNEG